MATIVLRSLRLVSLVGLLIASTALNARAELELPLARKVYFVGERLPLAWEPGEQVKIEVASDAGTTLLYEGKSHTILVDTSRLTPGEYRLLRNGAETGKQIRIVPTLRRSVGSMQDEAQPPEPRFPDQNNMTPEQKLAFVEAHWKNFEKTLDALQLSAIFPMAQDNVGQLPWLDVMARTGTLVLPNPDTRPTSFFPVGNHPGELDSMSQRVILGAQANGKYPNFGGFLFGWDTTGYAIGNRRGLMTYWGWGDKTEALRHYLGQIDKHTQDEFRRRTGMEPVTEAEYISYLLSIKRPEFATMIDLPTRNWLKQIAEHTKPMADAERVAFETRLDAWSSYMMAMYNEAYRTLGKNVRSVDSALRNSASVQVDHAPVRYGQYFPSAYEPLDFQYQSTWNDQVGGPDYSYQWLFTAGLLDMHRGNKPTWLSNTFGPVHGRSDTPGKFVRVAAHGLPWGVSGVGFALEGFSNVLGGMNSHSQWPAIEGNSGGADVLAGREFINRFSCLALEGRGDHGVGILFSRSQFQRQHQAMGFGVMAYQAFVTLTRLGYTPRFVTEEDLIAKGGKLAEPNLLVVGQTFALPSKVQTAIQEYLSAGGKVIVDDSTTVAIEGGTKLGYAFSFTQIGKPHSWSSPNLVAGDNDALMFGRVYEKLAPILDKAFSGRGQCLFKSDQGAKSQISLLQVDGGPDARYVVAVNDSYVKSQADWFQVREKLSPGETAQGWLFDCTEEKAQGKLAPFECNLTQTTARVFAVLNRELGSAEVMASQKVAAGSPVTIGVSFRDVAGKQLSAVIPFCLSVVRPDGRVHAELYRSTDREGAFAISVPLAVNLPTGKWTVQIRSQLNGEVVSLPVEIAAADAAKAPIAVDAASDAVVTREKQAIDQAFAKGSKLVLPIFDSPVADQLIPVAEKIKQVLAARGVEVEILRKPTPATYWLAYQLTDAQVAENANVEQGNAIGKLKSETVNRNDWFSSLSGWRAGKPVLLIDLASQQGDNPMAESLSSAGLLWPEVTANYPGKNRAVVEAVPWAFGPRLTSVVIRAHDLEGLLAGAASLGNLPEDQLTAHIHAVKAELWSQHRVGGAPAVPSVEGLTATGRNVASAPKPFAIAFPGERPPVADQVTRPTLPVQAAVAVPATFEPKQFVIFVRDGEGFAESATAEFLVPDLRFSDAIQLTVDVKTPGKYRLNIPGLFRYCDRKPCWQAQWEDVIELREKLVPKQRKPIEVAVQVDGKQVAILKASATAEKEVPLELASSSAGLKPKSQVEEVVTQITGELELPTGQHKLLLIPANIVDGKIEKIEIAAGK